MKRYVVRLTPLLPTDLSLVERRFWTRRGAERWANLFTRTAYSLKGWLFDESIQKV